ncbi:aromatic ring-hydroxylating dioxygenase subunit alpha [Mycobacterium spongiae]|uniref:Rieske-type oxygenase n=1 Tax=Mycobacterium spongiae TaxID=886343 RepID=A0A975JY19_9MYCO|nr:Rieske 2Fe-2S domain-containing protein [Mycobacterium spongiae]QUR67801.1 Rieske 2Fe-2S domain-containing protein [Mycobacterium spongiae]
MSDAITLSMKPTGWFQIGWSAEYQPGDIRPLKYFGQELVGYRSESGTFTLLDGHCPHLGAHLGYGGQVRGEDIQCPFHGWQWGPDGRNVCIPYQNRVTKRRVKVWPVAERNGVIYAWHDTEGRPPLCEVPDLFQLFESAGDPAMYQDPYPEGTLHRRDLTLHPQFVVENGVDVAHFTFVHRADNAPTIRRRSFDDWTFQTTMSMEFAVQDPDTQQARRVEGGLQAHLVGLGLSYAHAWGTGSVCSLTAPTPIDDNVAELRFTAWVDTADDPQRVLLSRRQRSAIAQVQADLNIWEHQRYTDPPVLATAEASGFKDIRQWARGFYPPSDDRSAELAGAGREMR